MIVVVMASQFWGRHVPDAADGLGIDESVTRTDDRLGELQFVDAKGNYLLHRQ